jgi:2-polyprenyl-6-methoxyphenol hydroxylase-like FAD-dependent oxidoreductase
VTLIERDRLLDDDLPRKGVPQSQHLHLLLAAGIRALDRLFPLLCSTAVSRGAIQKDVGQFGTVYLRGVQLPKLHLNCQSIMQSRPLLERCVRDQVRAHGRVEFRTEHSARGLLGDSKRIRGVRIAANDGDTVEELPADLVVDCTGKGSKLPTWLVDLGLRAAPEEVVRCDVRYSTCTIRRRPDQLDGQDVWAVTPTPPLRRFGAASAIEGDRYIITFTSYLGERGPSSFESMQAAARALPHPGLGELLSDADPLSDVVHMADPISRRRRYERLSRFPEGLLTLGDALCNFNPVYGQGMSVAALEAEALGRCLEQGTSRLGPRFFQAAARILDAPWLLATGGDFQWSEVEGRRPLGIHALNGFVARVIDGAGRDPRVASRMLEVLHLLEPPHRLLSWPVLRGLIPEPPSAVRRVLKLVQS